VETASQRGLSATIVEKDFWVCWTLKQIFTIDAFREMLLFKGGTSLSKVFGAPSFEHIMKQLSNLETEINRP